MFKKTILPVSDHYFRPAFWGNERDFRQVLENMESLWEGQAQNLNAQTKETEKAFLVSIDLPGVAKEDLDLQIEDSKVKIEAKRKNHFTEQESVISRTVSIPKTVDQEQIKAHLTDGVLYLALPKLEKQVAKKVQFVDQKDDSIWSHILEDKETENN